MNKKLIIAAAVIGVGYFFYKKSSNKQFKVGDLFPFPATSDWKPMSGGVAGGVRLTNSNLGISIIVQNGVITSVNKA